MVHMSSEQKKSRMKEKVASSRGSGDGVAKKEVAGDFSPEL